LPPDLTGLNLADVTRGPLAVQGPKRERRAWRTDVHAPIVTKRVPGARSTSARPEVGVRARPPSGPSFSVKLRSPAASHAHALPSATGTPRHRLPFDAPGMRCRFISAATTLSRTLNLCYLVNSQRVGQDLPPPLSGPLVRAAKRAVSVAPRDAQLPDAPPWPGLRVALYPGRPPKSASSSGQSAAYHDL